MLEICVVLCSDYYTVYLVLVAGQFKLNLIRESTSYNGTEALKDTGKN